MPAELSVEAICFKGAALVQVPEQTEQTRSRSAELNSVHGWYWEPGILTVQFLICCVWGQGIPRSWTSCRGVPKTKRPLAIEAHVFWLNRIQKEFSWCALRPLHDVNRSAVKAGYREIRVKSTFLMQTSRLVFLCNYRWSEHHSAPLAFWKVRCHNCSSNTSGKGFVLRQKLFPSHY